MNTIAEKGEGRQSRSDKETARQKDAARVLALLKRFESATPAELQEALGFTRLDWFSPHWRSVLGLCKKMGVVSLGSGSHRRYTLKGGK